MISYLFPRCLMRWSLWYALRTTSNDPSLFVWHLDQSLDRRSREVGERSKILRCVRHTVCFQRARIDTGCRREFIPRHPELILGTLQKILLIGIRHRFEM